METLPTNPKSSTEWLRIEYIRRLNKNPAYTLRSFARHLELSSGRMSELLSARRRLTFDGANKIADRLAYLPAERTALLDLVAKERSLHGGRAVQKSDPVYKDMSEEMFAIIADWFHFAILNLMKLKSFREEPRWIAARLGISVAEVRSAIDRLLLVDAITRDNEGKLQRSAEQWVTTYEVPSAALRRSHRQSLEQAIASLEDVPLPLRDVTSITFPADLTQIPKVKSLIKEFERRIAKLMHTDEASAVYNLNVQLIPVTKEKPL